MSQVKPLGIYLRTRGGAQYVQVSWRVNGRLCNTQFSVAKYGPVKATELAMDRRPQLYKDFTPRAVWHQLRSTS